MKRWHWFHLFVFVLFFSAVPVAEAGRQPKPASAVQLESFEYAWHRIAEVHPDPSLGGLNWQAVHDELLPQALAAHTNAELRVVLQDLVHRLPGQHHNVIAGNGGDIGTIDAPTKPHGRGGVGAAERLGNRQGEPQAAETIEKTPELRDGPSESIGSTLGNLEGLGAPPGLPGFLTRMVGGQQRVVWLEPDGPAIRAGLRIGDSLLRLDGQVCPGCELAGPMTQVAHVQFARGDEPPRELDIPRTTPGLFQAPPVGTSPPWPGFAGHWPLDGDRVRYVRISVFAVPTVAIFAAAVEAARNGSEQGIILDLRGNPGGFVQAGQGFAGYLLDSPQSLGRMVSREMNLQLKVNPRPEAQRFSGKVAVLVDRGSASTSELLAGALQELGRAKLFGEPTAGALESSLMERLPNGDTLQLVLASVEMPSGRIVEGSGLQPDVIAPLNAESLDQGRDPAIEAAINWISSPSRE